MDRSELVTTGSVFGSWKIIDPSPRKTTSCRVQYLCQCECGRESYVEKNNLVTGKSTKCRYCATARINIKHGKCYSRAYASWNHMMGRCYNPKNANFEYYGGRGITVCEKWRKFEGFYEDMGDPPKKHSLDRIDCEGGYLLSNCRWATNATQSRNTRACIYLEMNGETKTLSEWARELKVPMSSLYYKIVKKGMPFKEALSTFTFNN